MKVARQLKAQKLNRTVSYYLLFLIFFKYILN